MSTIVNRGTNRWALVIEHHVTDPVTGGRKRKQRWVSFKGTRKQANIKLTELEGQANRGEFIEPSKRTVREWLLEWLEKAVKPSRRLRTFETYSYVVSGSLIPALGEIFLQALKPVDIQVYYADHAKLAPATVLLHMTILSSALKSAVKNGLVSRNVVPLADGKPSRKIDGDVRMNCWSLEEARSFLTVSAKAGSRSAALFALALDSGARIGELGGMRWSDVDLEKGVWTLVRQLIKNKPKPGQEMFGPPKRGKTRKIDLNDETVKLLREHKQHQSELKLKNRLVYLADLDLVFAKEHSELFVTADQLGLPLQMTNLGRAGGPFDSLMIAAGVRRITMHGLRHTCATLLLAEGVPVKDVSERLGHSKASMTLDIYAHAMVSTQKDAARKLGAILHG